MVITLPHWVPNGNLFLWDTWNWVESLAREREKHFHILPPLGFCPTIMVLKAGFLPTALPPPMVGKEKVRDLKNLKIANWLVGQGRRR